MDSTGRLVLMGSSQSRSQPHPVSEADSKVGRSVRGTTLDLQKLLIEAIMTNQMFKPKGSKQQEPDHLIFVVLGAATCTAES